MDAHTFSKTWPGKLLSFEFISPKPIVPSGTTAFLGYSGLPASFTITSFETTFEFRATATPVARIWSRAVGEDWAMPHVWNRFWQIGDIKYPQHEAWLCMEEVTGRIVALCVGDDGPIVEINSSIRAMATCMKCMIDWCQQTEGHVRQIEQFKRLYRQMREPGDEEVPQYWLNLFAWADDYGMERLKFQIA